MSLLEKDKRKFSVIIGSKKCGACSGASPSAAARKVKGKSGAFYLKETTKGSKKKLYGPYSSKKKVIQRGGELKENTIRKQICNDILAILTNCNNPETLSELQQYYNDRFSVLKESYTLLNIGHRTDKCNSLRNIIGTRNGYYSKDGEYFPLNHCLCLESEKQQGIEFQYFIERGELISQYAINKNKNKYYKNHWTNFINFLRRIILQIEIEILEQNRKNNIKLRQIKEELNKETQNKLNEMKREIEEAKSLYAAQAGPAEERPLTKPSRYLLTNNELRELGINPNGSSLANPPTNLSQIPLSMLQPVGRRRNLNPIQLTHNSQKPIQKQPQKWNGSIERNLSAELGALLNNNNQQQKPPTSTNNLSARLQAALNND